MDPIENKTLITIKLFENKTLGVPLEMIYEDSLVEQDFGIAGLDSFNFYKEFFNEFSIVNPDDFNYDLHVSHDYIPLGLYIKAIFSKAAKEMLKYKDISIKHLIKVAELKRWFEEY